MAFSDRHVSPAPPSIFVASINNKHEKNIYDCQEFPRHDWPCKFNQFTLLIHKVANDRIGRHSMNTSIANQVERRRYRVIRDNIVSLKYPSAFTSLILLLFRQCVSCS